MATDPREPYGRLVHEKRLAFNAEQARPFVLLPWEDRDERQRELDMRIGATVAAAERARIRTAVSGVIATFAAHYGQGQGRADDLAEAVRQVLDREPVEPQERSDEEGPAS